MFPHVSIIILNWNGWKDTIECIESLYKINYPNYNIIIVDNFSEDNSIDEIKKYCKGKTKVKSNFFEYDISNKPIKIFEHTKEESDSFQENRSSDLPSNKKLTIIRNNQNDGFAEGNNIGINYALQNNSQYLLILNNDTVVTKDFLKKLVMAAEMNNEIGIVGPKIYFYDQPNVINSAGGEIMWNLGFGVNAGYGEEDKNQFNKIRECNILYGACMLIKSSVIQEIGLMDKNFFLLLEETDLCIRAKKAGYKLLFVPSSKIYHKEGISGKNSYLKTYYSSRNRLLLVKKHLKFFKKFMIIIL